MICLYLSQIAALTFLFCFFISLANLLEIKNHKMFKSSNSNILSNVKMNLFQDNLPIKLFITTEHFFILLISLDLSVLR